MARNGSGTMVRLYDFTDDSANGIKILASRQDEMWVDFANEITNSIAKDGQTTPTANLPMGTFRHTGVGAASARTDYARASQVQDGAFSYGAAGGTADAITVTLSPAITAYTAGLRVHTIASGANTGAVTLNVNGVGAQAVKKRGGTALDANDIPGAGYPLYFVHDGTDWELLNPASVGLTGAQTIAGNKTFSGSTTFSGSVTGGGIAYLAVNQSFTKAQGVARVALTDAATIAVDASLSNVFTVTLGGNRTLGQPTNPTDGQSITIFITQDATGSRTLAYHADWLFPNGVDPTLTTTAAAVDVLSAVYNGATTKWYAVLNRAFA